MAKNKIIRIFKEILKRTISIVFGFPIYQIARVFDLRIVFLFHQISDRPDYFSKSQNLNIKPYKFRKIIDIIIKYFEVVDEYIFFNQNLKKFRKKPLILITFDDGYSDAVEESHKISLKYSLPIIHFINTEYIQNSKVFSNKFSPAIKYYKYIENKNFQRENIFQNNQNIYSLKSETKYPKRSSISFLKDLNNKKVIYCSHGHNHIKYFHQENKDIISKDFLKSKIILEKNKFNNTYFAFPFGRVDSMIFSFLREITEDKVYFFLGLGALNNLKSMRNSRLVKRVNITSYDITFLKILYRISISIFMSISNKFKNLFSKIKIYH